MNLSEKLDTNSKAPRITPSDLDSNIVGTYYFNGREAVLSDHVVPPQYDSEALSLLTFCVLVLRNGFTVVGKSACASPENYNKEIGEEVALRDAKNQMWPLMGYHLKQTLFENPVGNTFKDRIRQELNELQGKIDKLSAFMTTDKYNSLGQRERNLQRSQLETMRTYRDILQNRYRLV